MKNSQQLLKEFDLQNLDESELINYNELIEDENMTKERALQILINNVDDTWNLSSELAEIAELQIRETSEQKDGKSDIHKLLERAYHMVDNKSHAGIKFCEDVEKYFSLSIDEHENEVVANKLELASELADSAVRIEILGTDLIDNDDTEAFYSIYRRDAENVIEYTTDAQRLFDDYYDGYLNVIEKFSRQLSIKTVATKEVRVYGIEVLQIEEDLHINNQTSDELFMETAEKQGNVWSLSGFQEQFNSEEINQENLIIRII